MTTTSTCLELTPLAVADETPTEPLAVLAARAACAMEQSIQRLVLASDENLGHLERQAAQDVQALLRQAIQRGAQAKADATPPICPVCGHKLTRLSSGQARTFQTRFGSITVQRTRGYCKRCRKWRIPADAALGLEASAGYSPAVQDMAALLASKMPVEDASAVLEHLTGVKLPRATLDREARRQGERAQALRTQLDQQAATEKKQLELTLEPYQMIIQLDAWNIRERDGWGQSRLLRRKGQEPERWHWVYTGTCFRLDQRGQTAGGRPVITERGFVATRAGLDACANNFTPRPCAVAWARRPARWSLAMGRRGFGDWPMTVGHKPANGWMTCHPHLVAVGRALFGEDKARFKTWLKLVKQLNTIPPSKSSDNWRISWRRCPAARRRKPLPKRFNTFTNTEPHGLSGRAAGRRTHWERPSRGQCRQTGASSARQSGESKVTKLLCLERSGATRWHLFLTPLQPARMHPPLSRL